MGTVYLAEQTEPVHRRVALKLIKRGMDSKQLLARFELERQALAVMNHNSIAKVLEAGCTDRGQPYFVMELVEGIPLTTYCDEHKLTLAERIAVFRQVCAGVQHAHQRGLVHRDLKPSNILATRNGDQHVVKIIDFGLARALDEQLAAPSIHTEQGLFVGTPEYMSPEQAGGVTLDIDTRTDIYSLGVILYELLVGELPFSSHELRKVGPSEMRRIVCEQDPQNPSTKVSNTGEAVSEIAELRGTSQQVLRRAVRGELDWIVMKAMAKERDRRYSSASDLARDLERHLAHEPVEAGPPSTMYRLRKIVRRYRVQVSAAALVFVAMAAGIFGTTRFMLEARRERNIAKAEKAHFDRLSVIVKLANAREELGHLNPAWPHKRAAIDQWLKTRGQDLLAELRRVRDTVRELRDKALPQTAKRMAKDREQHLSYAEYLALRDKKLPALRRAMAVRSGNATPQRVTLPAETLEGVIGLYDKAWERVGPERPADAYGEEALGLALARRVSELIGTKNPHRYGNTLAWALFANGLDERAKAASAAARDAASDKLRPECEANYVKLCRAVDTATATLAAAEARLVALESEIAKQRTWRFDDGADQFLHDTLSRVEQDLASFVGAEGELARVRNAQRWVEAIERATLEHPHAGATWEEARAAIEVADGVVASELYKAQPVDLAPQWGLVPIGMNPKTKLWEFYHLRSAWDPASGIEPSAIEIPRHEADGSIRVTESTGIVFVLIPGGTDVLGAQQDSRSKPNFAPTALSNETLHEVTLSAYFLARHEMTQGQWLRLSGAENPSFYRTGKWFHGTLVDLRHPVEFVSWFRWHELLERHVLSLPSQDEWEYACRAGTDSIWSTGNDESTLEGFANLRDESSMIMKHWSSWRVPFDDGHLIHAPVASFGGNAFGLFDMHGNVAEWCEDQYLESTHRVVRGAGFNNPAETARTTKPTSFTPDTEGFSTGCRPRRTVF